MMAFSTNFDKLVIDSWDRAIFRNITTGEILAIFDQIKEGLIENTSEQRTQTGLRGVVLNTLNRNKATNISLTNGYLVASGIGVQTGSGVEEASEENKFIVPEVEYIDVKSDTTKIVLRRTPVGTTGAEIPFIYKANKDLSQGKKFAISATASAKTFALDVKTRTITLPTGAFQAGDVVIVMYDYEDTVGKKISNRADTFGGTVELIIDATTHDICDDSILYHTKIVAPKLTVDSNFTISVGDEPATHTVAGKCSTDICSTSQELWNWFIVE